MKKTSGLPLASGGSPQPQTASQINGPQTGEYKFVPRAKPGWQGETAPHDAPAATCRGASWVPVGKELPDDELTVLLALADGEVCTGFHEAGKWYHESGDRLEGLVTHWMQFPAPPQIEGGLDMSKATAAEIVGNHILKTS